MITLNLPDEHAVFAFIREIPRHPADEMIGHAMVFFHGNHAMPWATYMVRKDGSCFHGDYVARESDARYSLLRRAGWATAERVQA